LSNTDQEWIEKYREALLASNQTKESRIRSLGKALAKAVTSPFRKIANLAIAPSQSAPPKSSTPTKITSAKQPVSQRQRKKKRAS
jgi:hypothetical protein